jgi:hypothetical protein
VAAAAALLSAATLTSTTANAMTPLGSVSAIQQALQDASVLEDVALVCRHRHWSSRQRCRVVCFHRRWSSRRVC